MDLRTTIDAYIALQPFHLQPKIRARLEELRKEVGDSEIKIHLILNNEVNTIIASSKPTLEFIGFSGEEFLNQPVWVFSNRLSQQFLPEMGSQSKISWGKYLSYQGKGQEYVRRDKNHLGFRFTIKTPKGYFEGTTRGEFVYYEDETEKRIIAVKIYAMTNAITQEEYERRKRDDELIFLSKPYDNRSPQRLREEKAVMVEILGQVNALTDDLRSFSDNIRKLLKDASIPVHFNKGKGTAFEVVAWSKESARFFRMMDEKKVVGKPVWNFRSMSQKHKISDEHLAKFWKSQAACTELIAEGKPLPITHVATKFAEKAECYIAHFHREYVYDRNGEMLGHLVFMPVEEITYEQFLLLEQQDSLVVEEEATSLQTLGESDKKIKRQTHYTSNIISQYSAIEKAKEYVETTDELAHLIEFEKTGETIGAIVLAVSHPVLWWMREIGIADSSDGIINKPLFNWFNLFANYMANVGDDKEGAARFIEEQQHYHALELEDKQPLPLVTSVRVKEADGSTRYLEIIFGGEFIVEETRRAVLAKMTLSEITEKEYEERKKTKMTVAPLVATEVIEQEIEEIKKLLEGNR